MSAFFVKTKTVSAPPNPTSALSSPHRQSRTVQYQASAVSTVCGPSLKVSHDESGRVTGQKISNAQLQSTPGSRGLTLRSLAGSVNYMKGEIEKDLELDLQVSVKCGFDQLLKYFLYLVLKDDSEEKSQIDELQANIENLQSARYYPKTKESSEGEDSEVSVVHETARQEEVIDDYENGTPTEQQEVGKREIMLNRLLKIGLEDVLKIANSKKIKKLLHKFAIACEKAEPHRYGPFVNLCNELLDALKITALRLPINSFDPESINIRFQVNHPGRIFSRFQGSKIDIDRSPDFCISSEAALFYHNGQVTVDYTVRLPKSLRWPILLLAGEFKVHSVTHPEGVYKEDPDLHEYAFSDEPVVETAHSMLQELDTSLEEAVANNSPVPSASRSKRSHEVALGDSEGQPPKKKVHAPTTIPSGTATNSNAKAATSGPVREVLADRQTQKAIEGRAQCASYALEMLSHGAGVHHVINLLFTDGILWVWYYDRQGIIQSTGVSLFYDVPRFILLLLAFQRFSLKDWGIIPALNPEALEEHTRPLSTQAKGKNKASPEDSTDDMQNDTAPLVNINLEEDLQDLRKFSSFWKDRGKNNVIELSHVELNMKEYLSHQPHCLTGRATSVVPAIGHGAPCDTANARAMGMVCKVYHPEVQRRHEGLTMEVVYKIVENDEIQASSNPETANAAKLNMLNHLPGIYFYGDVKNTTTHRIRSMVNRKWKGHRTMRIIGMKKLQKVTTLSGWNFVKAWLEGVICHAFLWKNFVEHGDPSISNLMYDPEEGCGVLTDFDLSLLQWEPRVFETDQTGTIPFMALDLLTKEYWKGLTKRYYYHELESFIWMLPYVFLRYKNGVAQPNDVVDSWKTSDIDTCRQKKRDFYFGGLVPAQQTVQSDFKHCWPLASLLCFALLDFHCDQEKRKLMSQNVPETFGWDTPTAEPPLTPEPPLPEPPPTPSTSYEVEDSNELWNKFSNTVKNLKTVQQPSFKLLLRSLEQYKPSFGSLTSEKKVELHARYLSALQ